MQNHTQNSWVKLLLERFRGKVVHRFSVRKRAAKNLEQIFYSNKLRFALGSSALLMAAACAHSGAVSGASERAEEQIADVGAIVSESINHPDRMADDSDNDERRKAKESLAFFGAGPGMSVFEIEAGSGYFTELLSRIVVDEGVVVMQNPEGFLAFVGDQITARLADNRLANVRQSISNFDALEAADASIDLVTWVQGPHELYYVQEDGSTLGDPATSYAEIFRITKLGGSFVVIDHAAIEGSPESSGNELHRIDKAIIINMATAAGFVFDGEGDFLANPDDDHTANVFDPSIRGKTDQFVLRFRKQE